MKQLRHAPCNRRRRIDPVDWPWCQFHKPIQQQWVVRAGQNDGVGARRLVIAGPDKAGRKFSRDLRVVHRAAAQGGFGQGCEVR